MKNRLIGMFTFILFFSCTSMGEEANVSCRYYPGRDLCMIMRSLTSSLSVNCSGNCNNHIQRQLRLMRHLDWYYNHHIEVGSTYDSVTGETSKQLARVLCGHSWSADPATISEIIYYARNIAAMTAEAQISAQTQNPILCQR